MGKGADIVRSTTVKDKCLLNQEAWHLVMLI